MNDTMIFSNEATLEVHPVSQMGMCSVVALSHLNGFSIFVDRYDIPIYYVWILVVTHRYKLVDRENIFSFQNV